MSSEELANELKGLHHGFDSGNVEEINQQQSNIHVIIENQVLQEQKPVQETDDGQLSQQSSLPDKEKQMEDLANSINALADDEKPAEALQAVDTARSLIENEYGPSHAPVQKTDNGNSSGQSDDQSS